MALNTLRVRFAVTKNLCDVVFIIRAVCVESMHTGALQCTPGEDCPAPDHR